MDGVSNELTEVIRIRGINQAVQKFSEEAIRDQSRAVRDNRKQLNLRVILEMT